MASIGSFNSCVAKEIAGIRSESPETSLLSICTHLEKMLYDPKTRLNTKIGEVSLPAFFVFTGVVNLGEGASEKAVGYGPAMRAFLESNSLGTVLETEERHNPLYAAPHGVKVWVWSPDLDKVNAWWEEKDPEVKERRAAAAELKAQVEAARKAAQDRAVLENAKYMARCQAQGLAYYDEKGAFHGPKQPPPQPLQPAAPAAVQELREAIIDDLKGN